MFGGRMEMKKTGFRVRNPVQKDEGMMIILRLPMP